MRIVLRRSRMPYLASIRLSADAMGEPQSLRFPRVRTIASDRAALISGGKPLKKRSKCSSGPGSSNIGLLIEVALSQPNGGACVLTYPFVANPAPLPEGLQSPEWTCAQANSMLVGGVGVRPEVHGHRPSSAMPLTRRAGSQ